MKEKLDTVYVATDLSARADEAIRQGDAWARRHKAYLIVGHVVPNVVGINILFPERDREQQAAQQRLVDVARATVVERVQKITGRGPLTEETFDVDVFAGVPDHELLYAAADAGADLIVLGDSGNGGLTRSLFGRTVAKVLRGSEVPVLIARPQSRGGPTLAATDFSDPAVPALRAGAADAKARDARAIFFHAVDFVATPSYGLAAGMIGAVPVVANDELIDAARKRLEAAAREVGADWAEVRVGLAGAAAQIINTVDEVGAALVVVGTHGRAGFRRLALGSVAESVAMNASCSVLVVRLGRRSRVRSLSGPTS